MSSRTIEKPTPCWQEVYLPGPYATYNWDAYLADAGVNLSYDTWFALRTGHHTLHRPPDVSAERWGQYQSQRGLLSYPMWEYRRERRQTPTEPRGADRDSWFLYQLCPLEMTYEDWLNNYLPTRRTPFSNHLVPFPVWNLYQAFHNNMLFHHWVSWYWVDAPVFTQPLVSRPLPLEEEFRRSEDDDDDTDDSAHNLPSTDHVARHRRLYNPLLLPPGNPDDESDSEEISSGRPSPMLTDRSSPRDDFPSSDDE